MIGSLDLGRPPDLQAVTVAPLNAIVRSGDDSSQFAVVVLARIESISCANASYVTLTLSDKLEETGQTPDDIGGRRAWLPFRWYHSSRCYSCLCTSYCDGFGSLNGRSTKIGLWSEIRSAKA